MEGGNTCTIVRANPLPKADEHFVPEKGTQVHFNVNVGQGQYASEERQTFPQSGAGLTPNDTRTLTVTVASF
jgi:hypothetical protein